MFEDYRDIVSADDLCEILFISKNTAYDLLRSGKIQSFKIGNAWKIPLNSVKEYVSNKVKIKCTKN